MDIYTHLYRIDYRKPWKEALSEIEAYLCGLDVCEDYFLTPISGGFLLRVIYAGPYTKASAAMSKIENASPRHCDTRADLRP